MKTKAELWRKFLQCLQWTPANILHRSPTSHAKSWESFREFQTEEKLFQVKVVLVGVVVFAIILCVTSIPLQTPAEYKLPWVAYYVNYYSLAIAVEHMLLVGLVILAERYQVCLWPSIFALVSYFPIIPLMSGMAFSRQMLDLRFYLSSMSLIFIVATVYFQVSFPFSLFMWLFIAVNSTIYLARNFEVEQVSLRACIHKIYFESLYANLKN